MSQKLPYYYALPAILLSTLLVVAIIWAWTEPAADPPLENVPAPINVGDADQAKVGSLGIGAPALPAVTLDVTGAAFIRGGFRTDLDTYLAVNSGNVGIGTTGPGRKLEVSDGTTNNAIRLAYWTASSDSHIDGLLPGSTFGSLIEGGTNSHIVVAIRDNDGGDSFSIVSGGGNYMTDTTYDTVVLHARASGNVGIGTADPGSYKLRVNGNVAATAFYYTSDINLKTNIEPLSDNLEKILNLQGVSFNWKDSNEPSIGLVAQEVEKIFPELVSGPEGEKTIDYARLVAPLIEAIKEQQKEIEELKAIIQ